MIGYCSRFGENDDLSLWWGQFKLLFSNVRALILRKIMRSRDVQCDTGEWPKN